MILFTFKTCLVKRMKASWSSTSSYPPFYNMTCRGISMVLLPLVFDLSLRERDNYVCSIFFMFPPLFLLSFFSCLSIRYSTSSIHKSRSSVLSIQPYSKYTNRKQCKLHAFYSQTYHKRKNEMEKKKEARVSQACPRPIKVKMERGCGWMEKCSLQVKSFIHLIISKNNSIAFRSVFVMQKAVVRKSCLCQLGSKNEWWLVGR